MLVNTLTGNTTYKQKVYTPISSLIYHLKSGATVWTTEKINVWLRKQNGTDVEVVKAQTVLEYMESMEEDDHVQILKNGNSDCLIQITGDPDLHLAFDIDATNNEYFEINLTNCFSAKSYDLFAIEGFERVRNLQIQSLKTLQTDNQKFNVGGYAMITMPLAELEKIIFKNTEGQTYERGVAEVKHLARLNGELKTLREPAGQDTGVSDYLLTCYEPKTYISFDLDQIDQIEIYATNGYNFKLVKMINA